MPAREWVQGLLALAALTGATVMAILGVISGDNAVTVYGVVLGYVFGYRLGSSNGA